MNITATIKNSYGRHEAIVATEGVQKSVAIPAKAEGMGSSVNGGELLFLALATCYGNDVYREAARRGLKVDSVEVTVSGQFGREGEPASHIEYAVSLQAPGCSEEELREFIRYVDSVAEIQNTLRKGVSVTLKESTGSNSLPG